MQNLLLVAHNIRSCHNVGSLLRTADGLGVRKVYLTGYTPYPLSVNDTRLPHIARKLNAQIHKTALGAEETVRWTHTENINECINDLRTSGYLIAALEQASTSIALPSFHTTQPVALIVGREVEGIEHEVVAACDVVLEIPMAGSKESFNVASAAAIALYHLRFVA